MNKRYKKSAQTSLPRQTVRQSAADVKNDMKLLAALLNGRGIRPSDAALRKELGWSEGRFQRAKNRLVAEGRVRSEGPRRKSSRAPLKIFVSYSHKDERLRAALAKHLVPLERAGLISIWHDRKIDGGEEWDSKITAELEAADIFLLLISIDFINSPYCCGKELRRAMERHERGSAVVVPVSLRACVWDHAPFEKLQPLPPDRRPISARGDMDRAMMEVAEGIRTIAEKLLASK